MIMDVYRYIDVIIADLNAVQVCGKENMLKLTSSIMRLEELKKHIEPASTDVQEERK